MPIAIFLFAILGAVGGFALSLCLGAGIVAAMAMTPLTGSAAAIGLCMLVANRPDASGPTAVRGSNSEPECIPAP